MGKIFGKNLEKELGNLAKWMKYSIIIHILVPVIIIVGIFLFVVVGMSNNDTLTTESVEMVEENINNDEIEFNEEQTKKEEFKRLSNKEDILCNTFCNTKNYNYGRASSYGEDIYGNIDYIKSCACGNELDDFSQLTYSYVKFRTIYDKFDNILSCKDVPILTDCIEVCRSWREEYKGYNETKKECYCYSYEYGRDTIETKEFSKC